jgi:hypothetical protein
VRPVNRNRQGICHGGSLFHAPCHLKQCYFAANPRPPAANFAHPTWGPRIFFGVPRAKPMITRALALAARLQCGGQEKRMNRPSIATPVTDREWLDYEHNWLDARMGAVFMNMVWGARAAAEDELTRYQLEHEGHTGRARERLFSPLAGLDTRTLAAEGRDWAFHDEDVHQAIDAVRLGLRSSGGGGAFAAFEGLRRAVRRQWAEERRLLDMAAQFQSAPIELAALASAP